MKTFRLLGVSIVAVGIAAGVWVWHGKQQPAGAIAPDPMERTVDVRPTEAPPQESPTMQSGEAERPVASTAPASQAAASPARAAPKGIQPGDTRARTQEEVDWMNANLYPSREDQRGDGDWSPDDLPQDSVPRTAADLVAAENVANSKQWTDEERDRARSVLLNGADNGYTYALVALGAHFELVSPVDSQAYYRAALYSGDWTIGARPNPQMPHVADFAATLMAHKILQNIDTNRARRGLPPLVRELRPGMDQVLDAVTYSLMTGEGMRPPSAQQTPARP